MGLLGGKLRLRFLGDDFTGDAGLLRRYGDIELTREIFDAYKAKVTLSGVYGTGAQLHKDHHGLGVPMSVANGEILATLLNCLKERGGVILPSGPNTPLGDKIAAALAAGISNDSWIGFPDEYMVSGPSEGKMRATLSWLTRVPAPA